MNNETKIKKIKAVLKTFKRKPAESRLDNEIPDWRELVPRWESITRLSPGSPEYRDQILNITLLDDQLNQEMLQEKIRGVLKTFKRDFAEYYLDNEIPDWRELEPEWQSITMLPPGDPGRLRHDEEPKDIPKYSKKWQKLPQKRKESQDDPLFNRAVEIVTREGKVSTSFLQRHLQIGYDRAARMLKSMEDRGVISQPDELGRHEILVDPELLQEREESQEKLPAKVDLSNKELQVRIEDELKNLLQAIRASVDLYPEDLPQYQHETDMFTSNKPQEVSLENYPNAYKLFKSFIVEHLRKGGGTPPYEVRRSEMFNAGVTDFYEQSKGLTTSGFYDINTISELGFRTVPQDLKEFMKDAGIPAVRGLSRGLREVFRYFTGSFAEPGKAPISTAYSGRNPQLQRILDSIPVLAPVGEGRYIIANRLGSDASDLGPVYEKYMNVKPGTGTLPEQMQLLEDTTGTGTVRSMIDPSRQVQPLETKYQRQLFQHLIRRFNEPGGLSKEPKERPVDVAAITRRFQYIKNPHARRAAIENAIQDAEQAAKKAGPVKGYQQEKKKLGFQPDPEEAAPFVEEDFSDAYTYDPDDPDLGSEEELGVLDAVPDMGFGGDQEPEKEFTPEVEKDDTWWGEELLEDISQAAGSIFRSKQKPTTPSSPKPSVPSSPKPAKPSSESFKNWTLKQEKNIFQLEKKWNVKLSPQQKTTILESNFKKDFPGQRITTLQELQSQREKPKGGVKAGILGVIPILEWAGGYYDTGPKGIKRGGIIKNKQVSLKDQMNRLT